MSRYKIGYTQGTFDMFHVGHLNLIKRAKANCDFLIVGINSDKLVLEYKDKLPVVPQMDRLEIVSALKYVDKVVLTKTLDKYLMYEEYGFDVIFIGDDWKGNTRWKLTEKTMNELGVDVVYLPYTKGVSSSLLREKKGNTV